MFSSCARWTVIATAVAALLSPVVVSVAAAQPQSPLTELVDATARRLEVAEPVALAKFGNGQPVKDPQREQQVIDTVIAEATTLGADPAVVATVFRDQIDASVAIQYARMSQWTLDPATVPATAGDLAASRAVLDAVNREMVTRLVEQRGVLTSPLCAVELDRARAAVAQARAFDPLYRRALEVATRNYCR
ncbi:chorismate mutase AroQ, gamma subclass [Mycolicibacterium duvalii]|uniref:chorismate mutase n=1 Tax=Mycolicibacterium duvalii TaxID=39688 RepID=A0A7I7K9U9_9MYCO|nr:chorismate mutase [Mycolicibacterium duvalii]MCV7366418.1 chorismate mutase [Mycolicibacterium duvalii]PEG43790.1 chorismate mutase AroQ, gamma subclass [Mycolicibacterium duvalii]BBX20248.1 secreted chorismate mutase [Mycolicibacterium duvalii]